MTGTLGQILAGSTLYFNGAKIGEVIDVNGTRFTRGKTGVLTTESKNNNEENLKGAGSFGDLTATAVYRSAEADTYATLAAAADAGTEGAAKFELKDGSYLQADLSFIASLGFPKAGGAANTLTVDISFTPLGEDGWKFYPKAA